MDVVDASQHTNSAPVEAFSLPAYVPSFDACAENGNVEFIAVAAVPFVVIVIMFEKKQTCPTNLYLPTAETLVKEPVAEVITGAQINHLVS